jgi:hypothetical protein
MSAYDREYLQGWSFGVLTIFNLRPVSHTKRLIRGGIMKGHRRTPFQSGLFDAYLVAAQG